jgi:hypothetical protein
MAPVWHPYWRHSRRIRRARSIRLSAAIGDPGFTRNTPSQTYSIPGAISYPCIAQAPVSSAAAS